MIDTFDGKYEFLSNFYPSVITLDDIIYPTVEHAFQAQKVVSDDIRQMIANCDTPGKAKSVGRSVLIRPNWEEIKDGIMLRALQEKFSDPNLAKLLINTGNKKLVEGNTWNDRYWGVCRGVGKNMLGKLLMQVRQDLINN